MDGRSRANNVMAVAALIATRRRGGQTEVLSVRPAGREAYLFPGGKLEPHETPENAVCREVEEELGVRPTQATYAGRFDGFTPNGLPLAIHLFVGSVSEKASASGEIEEIRWFTLQEMIDQKELFTPITINEIVPALRRRQVA